jgi:hypothetical protein
MRLRISDCGLRISLADLPLRRIKLVGSSIRGAVRNSMSLNPQSEIRNPKSPITDSPWFWVLVFSLMALGALAAISGKYGRRQAALERQYQARQRVVERVPVGDPPRGGDSQRLEQSERRRFVSPGDTLIPLWPLAVVLVVLALIASAMLVRGRGRPGSQGNIIAPP